MMTSLKIVSWNINSVRFRIEIVERFLREVSPDILCLQETKVIDGDFPTAPFRALGYNHIFLHGQRMHHGVAIISRVPLIEDDRFDWQANREARHVGVRLENGMRIENVYVPAGGDVPDSELEARCTSLTADSVRTRSLGGCLAKTMPRRVRSLAAWPCGV